MAASSPVGCALCMAPKPRDQSSTDTTAGTCDGLPQSGELLGSLGRKTRECPVEEDCVILTFFCRQRGGSTGGAEPAARADGLEEVPLHTSHLNLMMHHGVAGYRLILILVHRLSGPFVDGVRVCGCTHGRLERVWNRRTKGELTPHERLAEI